MKKIESLKFHKLNRAILIRLTGLLGIIIFSLISVSAQGSATDGSTPSGLKKGAPASAYSLSDMDTVNFYNGNLNFQLPLLNVGGRGSAAAALNFSLNSKSWRVKHYHSNYPDTGQIPEPVTGNIPTATDWYSGSSEGLYDTSLSFGRLVGRQVGGLYKTNCQAPGGGLYRNINKITLTRLTFVSPDGTEFELRDQLTDGERKVTENPCTPGFRTFNRGKVFVSRDGSGATFVSDTDILDYSGGARNIYPSGYMLLANGTRLRLDSGRISWMRDRNGNKLTDSYDSETRLRTITDSLGRQTIVQYNNRQPGLYDEIRFSGFGGVQRTIRITWDSLGNCLRNGEVLKSSHQLFPELGNSNLTTVFNPTVRSSITLPDGRQYRFYYNSYGELARVVTPTDGAVEYDYTPGSGVMPGSEGYEIYRRIVERRVYSNAADPNSLVSKMIIGNTAQGSVEVKQIAPNGAVLSRELHYYYGDPAQSIFDPSEDPTSYSDWMEGREYKTSAYKVNADGSYTEMRRNETFYEQRTPVSWWTLGIHNGPASDPRVAKTVTTLVDAGLKSKQTFGYEANIPYNNQSDVYEYGYGTDENSLPLIRHSHTNYLHTNVIGGTTYTYDMPIFDTNGNLDPAQTIYLRGLVKESLVYGVNPTTGQELTTPSAKSEILYDEPAYLLNDYASVLQWENTGAPRGNATTAKSWYDAANANAFYQTHTQYDQCGNARKVWDAKGNTSEIEYWSYNNTYAFPILTRSAVPDPSGLNGSNQTFVSTATFDFASGLAVSSTDANGITSTIEYNDLLDRPTRSRTAVGTALERQAKIIYDDANHRIEQTADLFALNDNLLKSESFYDGLGRTLESRKYEADGGYIAVNSVPLTFIQDAETGQWFSAAKSTNPYRPNAGEQAVWTTSISDSLGRNTKVILPDGAKVKTDYGFSTSGAIGLTKQITDQAGKKRKGITDTFGRMIRVIEDPDGQNLSTDYVFDTFGNLRKTIQGEQSRYFSYDSFGRLLYAKQPEQEANNAFSFTDPVTGNTQWSVKYVYDENSNITSTIDARNVSVTGTYDHLNRLISRDYSDTTPDVAFYYDGRGLGLSSIPDSFKGKTTRVSSSVSETKYTNFDILGRLLAHSQTTDGQTYTTGYQYNLSSLVSETYPSGRTVKYDYNTNGEVASVWGTVGSQNRLYVNSISYNSAGAIDRLRLGNGKWEKAKYNNRLQVTEIGLGNSATDESLLKLEYGYGDNTQNNGSMRSQKISFNGLSQPFEQTYSYDNLNRLQSAEEKVNNQTSWKQTFLYDRYGNRRFDAANTTTLGQSNNITNPTIDTATNRFSTGQNYLYDKSGNLTVDASGNQFLYDAENHQKEIKNSANQTIGLYLYDGEGKRVKKISSTETTVFVYDGGGQLVAEYSTQISQTPQVSYLTADHLGSPRVITDQTGKVTTRKDYMAFGEETYSQQRTTALNYDNQSETRKGYTGYEKDDESGLDFAQARYYNSSHGRFTSVDPLTASANVKDPQTFNRYSYALNSPYKFTDPLGLVAASPGNNGERTSNGCGADSSRCSDDYTSSLPNQDNQSNNAAPAGNCTSGECDSSGAAGEPGEPNQSAQDAPPSPKYYFGTPVFTEDFGLITERTEEPDEDGLVMASVGEGGNFTFALLNSETNKYVNNYNYTLVEVSGGLGEIAIHTDKVPPFNGIITLPGLFIDGYSEFIEPTSPNPEYKPGDINRNVPKKTANYKLIIDTGNGLISEISYQTSVSRLNGNTIVNPVQWKITKRPSIKQFEHKKDAQGQPRK